MRLKTENTESRKKVKSTTALAIVPNCDLKLGLETLRNNH